MRGATQFRKVRISITVELREHDRTAVTRNARDLVQGVKDNLGLWVEARHGEVEEFDAEVKEV